MRGAKFKKKKAAAFGSYGWSGESVKLINEELVKAGFELVDDGRRIQWGPDGAVLEELRDYGRTLAGKIPLSPSGSFSYPGGGFRRVFISLFREIEWKENRAKRRIFEHFED